MLQKTKQVGLSLLMLLAAGMALAVTTVSAATTQPKGTCFLTVQGQTKTQIGLCKKILPGVKDDNGKPSTSSGTALNPKSCYEVTEGLSSSSITEVNCDDTPKKAATEVCYDANGNPLPPDSSDCNVTPASKGNVCGGPKDDGRTTISIDIGCRGEGNSITDATFAIIRFLSNGVGVVLVASMVYAGIQYSASKGDPNGMNQAINRIRSNVFALLLFIFAYALLNYVIPGQVFK